jgi:Glycosyl transferase 4-like domain
MTARHRVCLVGPGHVASNPRLVKEADALHAAGFQVRVVSGDYMAAIRPLDRAVFARSGWRARTVGQGTLPGRLLRALRRRTCRWLVERGVTSVGIAVAAENDLVARLARAAAAEPADLFIGHYLPGLVAAARAAARHGAALGFDAEDSHVDELPDVPVFRAQRSAREHVERTLLPRCRHLTAASPGIADALARRYGVMARTVLNVFPLGEAPSEPTSTAYQKGHGPPTLYWFSQTVGPGRGLEPVVDALGKMRTPARLHLRGLVARGYGEELNARAARAGAADRIVFHAPEEPSRMAALAAPHDLGLALERCEPPHRAICLTNKIFTYLLAGVPVLYSPTPAQERLAPELGGAAFRAEREDGDRLAACLDAYFQDSARQIEARRTARKLGQDRFNWDVEQHAFLDSVRRALGVPT